MKCIQNEVPFELPEGWEWCRLRDIFTICSSKRVLQSNWKKTGVPFYRAREIVKLSEYGMVNNELFISEEHYSELKEKYGVPQAGDIMISGVGTIGKVYVVKEDDKFYYKDASVLCFQNTYNIINPQFAKYILESKFMQQQMYSYSKGTTVDTITISTAMDYIFLLPPLQEQHSIVAKITELLSFVDSIESDKIFLLTTIDQTKAKILDLAIRGKLVPQDPNDEPASVLLERIKAEKESLIRQGRIKRNKKESVIFKGEDNSYYEKIGNIARNINDELPFDIPENWAWIRLQTCCQKEIKRGKSPKYAESSDTLVFAQKCNTKYDGINMDLALYLDESTLVKYPDDEYMQDKDTVINSTGTGTLGRVGIYRRTDNRREMPVVPDSHVTVIRANNEISAEYIYHFLKAYQQELEKLGEGSTNQKELKPLTLKNLIVALPPYAEQERIIEIITAAFEIMTNIEKSLS